jgi:hypothetical protein
MTIANILLRDKAITNNNNSLEDSLLTRTLRICLSLGKELSRVKIVDLLLISHLSDCMPLLEEKAAFSSSEKGI